MKFLIESANLIDQIGSFILIIKPTPESILEDIFYYTYFKRFMNETRGGLNFENIAGIFKVENEKEAKQYALQLLEKRDKSSRRNP
jgi:hypothetical protein